MTPVLFLVLLLLALVIAMIYVPRFLMRRALRKLVSQFRQRGATSPTKTTTLEELGLVQGNPLERMFKARDYRPYALRVLGRENIVRATEEGGLYLSEEALKRSPIKSLAGIE